MDETVVDCIPLAFVVFVTLRSATMASWVQEYNYTVGRAYWRNASTGETSWDPPGAAGSAGTVDAEQASAVALQAHIKGRQVRKEQEKRATSAKMVQSVYRGREARHQLSGGARRKKYYTPADVAAHDRADDLWVSLFHKAHRSAHICL